jgi:prepilin-type processing-associated H-X9-DG protein
LPDDPDPIAGWWWSGNPGDTFYNHVLTPNQTSCTSQAPWVTGIFNAASEHPAGINVLMGDGHVMFVSSAVHAQVWIAMGSRNGREVFSSF